MKTPLVSLRRVSVSYDGHDALKEVDLDIYPDDFLGIIGPNGGGKTTLVKAIVGTIPYRGTISYSPQLFRGKERLIGYMPQQSIFDRSFPISVLEVVMSGLHGRSQARGHDGRGRLLRRGIPFGTLRRTFAAPVRHDRRHHGG